MVQLKVCLVIASFLFPLFHFSHFHNPVQFGTPAASSQAQHLFLPSLQRSTQVFRPFSSGLSIQYLQRPVKGSSHRSQLAHSSLQIVVLMYLYSSKASIQSFLVPASHVSLFNQADRTKEATAKRNAKLTRNLIFFCFGLCCS